jgi:hypothetical protein
MIAKMRKVMRREGREYLHPYNLRSPMGLSDK